MSHEHLQDRDYLGDGVYVGHDGQGQVWLWLEGDARPCWVGIALEFEVLAALLRWLERTAAARGAS